ncbi:hypothetical protein [Streptomyces sp. WM6372]|uniref:hypothetical protein n=1 Tax=Streptomyces sp. WM6372 TaxID=1415555 RepID=UPI001F431E65|nr:hypothetical protein [Streptomyces sp. WM6372]
MAAEVQLVTEAGECPGEVLVFAQGGYLSVLAGSLFMERRHRSDTGRRASLVADTLLIPNDQRPTASATPPTSRIQVQKRWPRRRAADAAPDGLLQEQGLGFQCYLDHVYLTAQVNTRPYADSSNPAKCLYYPKPM